jgi:hypothetical protein
MADRTPSLRRPAAAGLATAMLAALCAVLVCAPSARGAAFDMMDEPMEFNGADMHYAQEKNAYVIRGYGVATKGGLQIKARNMVIFVDTKELYAEGDVTVQLPDWGSIVHCDSVFLNLEEFVGEAVNVHAAGTNPMLGPGTVRTEMSLQDPLGGPNRVGGGFDEGEIAFNRGFVHARKMRVNSKDHVEIFDAVMTTDNSPKNQVYSFRSPAAQYRRGEKIESWNNSLWIGRIPVFYFPYVIKDLRYDWPWMRFAGGENDDWGLYGLSTWGIDLDPEATDFFRLEKIYAHIDWREERGWAFGPALRYELGHRKSAGRLDTYYLNEYGISDSADAERAEDDTEYGDLYQDEDRYRIKWEHYQDLPGEWDLRAQVEHYSDRDMRFEYFNREFNEEKEPEAYVDLRKLNDDYELEIIARKRTNDHLTQAEYLPELRFNVPGLALGQSGFYLRSETRLGVINKAFDEDLADNERFAQYRTTDDDFGAFFRAHQDTRLYRPIALGKAFTLTPYVGGRATYYEDLYDDDEGHTNTAGLYGATLKGRFYGSFRGGEVRHIVEPTISLVANEDPTFTPEDIWFVDEVDLFTESHAVELALHQKIQVKRNGRIVDLLDLDISGRYLPIDDEAEHRHHEGHNWSPILFDAVWRPTDNLTLYGDLSWEPEANYVASGTIGTEWKYRDLFRLDFSHRYSRNPETDFKSSYTSGALRWLASDKYALEAAMSYEWARDDDEHGIEQGLARQRISVIRNLKVLELTLSWTRDVRDGDTGVYLTLSPLGIEPLERADIRDDFISRQHGRYSPTVVSDEAYEEAYREAYQPADEIIQEP